MENRNTKAPLIPQGTYGQEGNGTGVGGERTMRREIKVPTPPFRRTRYGMARWNLGRRWPETTAEPGLAAARAVMPEGSGSSASLPQYGELPVTREGEEVQEPHSWGQDETREGACVDPDAIWPCECHETGSEVDITCYGLASSDMLDRALIPEYKFNNMTKLTSMYSKLGHLHKDILHGKTFEVLELVSSSLVSVADGAFDGCRERLVRLGLTTNSLKTFPFKDLPLFPRLETLSLGGNELETIDDLVGLPELPITVLYLGNNQISSLHPDVFVSVPRLSVLELNGNNLTSLPPEVFMPLNELQILYVYKNNFKHLATGTFWFSTPILRSLDVRNCHIETVGRDVFRGVDYSTKVDLGNNKFTSMLYDVFWPVLHNVSTRYGWLSVMLSLRLYYSARERGRGMNFPP
ncbi:uncharacterized protein [Panulirus ornatus]|uniref:uncharacterized protein isoform X3 n=1 Tax=Panulirus ornatus TaxID=150431 RepID=UPI003A8460DB